MSEVAVAPSPTIDDDFDAVAAARGPALWRRAWLLTGDHQRAEDLVQTALGKAWPHWQRISASGSFEAYVRKGLTTAGLNALRCIVRYRASPADHARLCDLSGEITTSR